MRSLSTIALVVLLLPAGCRSSAKPERGGVAAAPIPSALEMENAAAAPSAAAVAMTVHLARCGWGTVKAEPDTEAPPFAIALVDVEAPAPVQGLHLTALELGNGAEVVGKMGGRATLRVQEGAVSYSFGAANTQEVGAGLAAGAHRIRAAAALDRPRKSIATKRPSTCAVVLGWHDDAQVVATGAVDPEWENE